MFGTEPTGVTVNGQAIQPAATLDEFQAAQTAYYYSSSEKLVYIKTAAGDASEIEIEGIYQAPYEAEHAEQANVAVNTDHEGYYGEGFVDQFASEGCAVTFTVYSDSDTALLDVRYSAGTEAAQRTESPYCSTCRKRKTGIAGTQYLFLSNWCRGKIQLQFPIRRGTSPEST